ncbi:hypothetical protein Hanom_Chr09g00859241 [Helianthus anomalus]
MYIIRAHLNTCIHKHTKRNAEFLQDSSPLSMTSRSASGRTFQNSPTMKR